MSYPSRGNKRTIVRGAKGGSLPHLMMIACADVEETYGKRLTFCLLPLRISPLQTFILLVAASRKPSMQELIASLAAIRTEAAKCFQQVETSQAAGDGMLPLEMRIKGRLD